MSTDQNRLQTTGGPPPPITPGAAPRSSGCWKYLAIGCVVLVVLAVVGGILTYYGVRHFVGGMVEEYTDPAPAPLPVVEAPPGDGSAVVERVEAFAAAVERGESPPPLVLSGQDVNLLIEHHPEWRKLAGKVHVAIEGDQITARAALPLDELGWLFKGRYLNGTFAFRVELVQGRLVLFVDSADVNGRQLPDEIMNALRGRNLAEDANQDPDVRRALEKIGSIAVRDGNLVITPASQ